MTQKEIKKKKQNKTKNSKDDDDNSGNSNYNNHNFENHNKNCRTSCKAAWIEYPLCRSTSIDNLQLFIYGVKSRLGYPISIASKGKFLHHILWLSKCKNGSVKIAVGVIYLYQYLLFHKFKSLHDIIENRFFFGMFLTMSAIFLEM